MWIEQTKNGLRLCDRYTGMDGKVHRASVPLLRDTAQARRKAQEELQNRIMNKYANLTEMPFSELVELYLNRKEIKPSTLTNYESAFSQIKNLLGDVLIDRLTAPYVLRRLSESNKAPTTLNRYIVLLNGLLAWAHQYGYVSDLIHIRMFSVKNIQIKDIDVEYLEASELQHVLDQLRGTMAYYLCKFLALTGMRIGEAAALTLDDVDDRYIHVTKAWKIENGLSTPKTIHSVRDVYIQPELRAFLKEYKEWRLLHMMAYGIRSDLLFFTAKGNHYSSNALLLRIRKLDSPKHIHPHIFRHTHAALLAEQGLSLESIARRLGHSDSNITKKIYIHVTEKLKEKEEAALDMVNIL